MKKDVLIILVIIVMIIAIIIMGIYGVMKGIIGPSSKDPQKLLIEKIQENYGNNYEMMQVYKIGGIEGLSHGCGAFFVTDGNLIEAQLTAEPYSRNYDNYTEESIDYIENEEIKKLMFAVNTINMMYEHKNYEGEDTCILKIIMQGNDFTDFLAYKQEIVRVAEYCRNLYDSSSIGLYIAHTTDFDNIYYQAYTFKIKKHPDEIYYDITETKTDMEEYNLNLRIDREDTTADIEKNFDTKYENLKTYIELQL